VLHRRVPLPLLQREMEDHAGDRDRAPWPCACSRRDAGRRVRGVRKEEMNPSIWRKSSENPKTG
jgi:hypothetical protein